MDSVGLCVVFLVTPVTCPSVCRVFVRSLNDGKWHELSMPKCVEIYSMAGPQHALTLRSEGPVGFGP